MPLPLEQKYVMPMAIVRAGAEAYLAADPSQYTSFTDFFAQHGMRQPEGYSGLYSPSVLLEECGLGPSIGPASDHMEHFRVRHYLSFLLEGAAEDTLHVCRAVRPFLRQSGAEEDQIIPILQNSRHLAQQIGSVDPDRGLMCLLNALNDSPSFAIRQNEDGSIHSVDLTPGSKQEYIRPNIGKDVGCPLLTQVVRRPEQSTNTHSATPYVKLYDLYWEALVASVYDGSIGRLRPAYNPLSP